MEATPTPKDGPKYCRFTSKGRGLTLERIEPPNAKRGELVCITYREHTARGLPTNRLWTRWVYKRAGGYWK
jgi:hypothetical protein